MRNDQVTVGQPNTAYSQYRTNRTSPQSVKKSLGLITKAGFAAICAITAENCLKEKVPLSGWLLACGCLVLIYKKAIYDQELHSRHSNQQLKHERTWNEIPSQPARELAPTKHEAKNASGQTSRMFSDDFPSGNDSIYTDYLTTQVAAVPTLPASNDDQYTPNEYSTDVETKNERPNRTQPEETQISFLPQEFHSGSPGVQTSHKDGWLWTYRTPSST